MQRRRLVLLSTAFLSLSLLSPGIPGKTPLAGEGRAEQPVPENQTVVSWNTMDMSKGAIEGNTNSVVAGQSTTLVTGNFDNPKTGPGLVRWHVSFAAACQAAGKSGKPVLLFQMMGKLDEQFC